MPTRDVAESFWRDSDRLTPAHQREYRQAIAKVIEDLKRRRGFRPGLRVKRVRGHPGVFELTWAADGRATFSYGSERVPGEPHIIWRRIGTHEILKAP